MDLKICSVCKIEKSKESFSKKRGACKKCRATNSKDDYKNTRLAEREIKRKEFFKILEQRCKDEGEEFNFRKVFLEEELLALMRLKPDLYSFCEVPEQIANEVKASDDFKDGYILKHILISDKTRNRAYTRVII